MTLSNWWLHSQNQLFVRVLYALGVRSLGIWLTADFLYAFLQGRLLLASILMPYYTWARIVGGSARLVVTVVLLTRIVWLLCRKGLPRSVLAVLIITATRLLVTAG
ncbi:MAG: hypothetical protein IPP67_00280 [Rhodospirillaceae bacterium]|nr:hypothetical protein [Rhodospirillaceae bacterium]